MKSPWKMQNICHTLIFVKKNLIFSTHFFGTHTIKVIGLICFSLSWPCQIGLWTCISFLYLKHLWPFSTSKFNLKSDRIHLVAPASPIECLLYFPYVRAIQYKLGPEKLTRLGNSNVLRLPVFYSLRLFSRGTPITPPPPGST